MTIKEFTHSSPLLDRARITALYPNVKPLTLDIIEIAQKHLGKAQRVIDALRETEALHLDRIEHNAKLETELRNKLRRLRVTVGKQEDRIEHLANSNRRLREARNEAYEDAGKLNTLNKGLLESCYNCEKSAEDQRDAEAKAGQLINNVTMIEPERG